MTSLGLPSITIAFTSTGITAIERSTRGIVAMILKDNISTAVAGSRTVDISTNFVAGDTVIFDGVTFTASATKQDSTDFEVGSSIIATAANIATALNANTTINALFTATAASGAITVTEKTAGGGNTPGEFAITGTGVIADGTVVNSSASGDNPYTIYDETDIPDGLTDANKEQIELALEGYQTAPKHILVYVQPTATSGYDSNLLELEHSRWDYLVIPDISPAEVTTIATWIKALRTTKDKKVKAVLPNCAADSEGIINFTNTQIVTSSKTYTTAQYCSRIAGIICGTPMTISCTFAPLSEVVNCDKYTKDQMDTKIGNGELFIMFDGTKYKIARGVNSFVTTIEGKGDQFKKIKLIDLMDMIHDDIKDTANDSYIGKYANSYDNKCVLIAAIQGYFTELELEGLLETGQNTCALDTDSTSAWILSNGKKTSAEIAAMTTQEIKEFNTSDQVFLVSTISMLDAIEAITLNITI